MRAREEGRRADLVAVFDNQDDAEEAVLRLRNAGVPGRRLGFFAHTHTGRLIDLIYPAHRIAGTVVGLAVGIALGWALGDWVGRATGPDPVGLAVTCALCGASIGGVAGWLIGSSLYRPGVRFADPGAASGEYVVVAAAGPDRGRAAEAIRRAGGHEVEPVAPLPAAV